MGTKQAPVFWMRNRRGLKVSMHAISGPVSMRVLAPKEPTGTRLLLFGDVHESDAGHCDDTGVLIHSREFLEAFDELATGVVVFATEDFVHETAYAQELYADPEKLQRALEFAETPWSQYPLGKFANRLEACSFAQSRWLHAKAKRSPWLKKMCPYKHIRVLWADIRTILHAPPKTRAKYYWDVLVFSVTTLMYRDTHRPDMAQVAADLAAASDAAKVSKEELLDQVLHAVDQIAWQKLEAADLFPPKHRHHSLLWKQLLKLGKREQAAWTTALLAFCRSAQSSVVQKYKNRTEVETKNAQAEFARSLKAALFAGQALPVYDPFLVFPGLFVGAFLVDCYLLLRLQGKYNKAQRAVLYLGELHVGEYMRFYVDILHSHTLAYEQREPSNPGGPTRCLRPPRDVEL